jgi:hypothetical protein
MEQENLVPGPAAIELKAHVPAKDFEISKQFYQDIGFTLCWSNGGLALLHYGPHGIFGLPAFLLQENYVKEFAEHLNMHFMVKDVDAWWKHIQAKQISQKYGVAIGEPGDREWGHRDFTLVDPSGVQWRISQEIE